jgi:cytochrome P450
MSATDQPPTCPASFDHHTSPRDQHVWDACRDLRENCPIGWSDRYDGHWVAARYEDVRRVLRDFRDFGSHRLDPEYMSLLLPARRFPLSIPAEFDPPDNRPYRQRLNAVLSRAAVRELEPMIRRWTTHFIDRVIQAGACDLAQDISTPIPAMVTLEWLGMPQEIAERAIVAYHDYLGFPHDHPRAEKAWADIVWLNARIQEELESRREQPRDDVVSFLIHDKGEDGGLPFDMVCETVKNLLGAGIDTTTNGLAWGLYHLAEHPDHAEQLRRDPELWDTAVDELLRRYPPVTCFARTVLNDLEIGGCPVKAGDRVLALMASANHDEDAFPDALDVVLDRTPNAHMAFGTGVHRCVGMHLARMEMRVVLSEAISRMRDIKIDKGRAEQYEDQGNVAGWLSLPATFTPSV